MNRTCSLSASQVLFAFPLLVLLIVLGGCSDPPPTKAPTPDVTVMTMEAKDTSVSFAFVGITVSSQQVEVRARVNGFLEERLYTEGSMVRKGQAMFSMDRKPFEADLASAKGALAQQKARLWTAQRNLKRVKPLAKANALSKKDLDDALGRVNEAAAAVEMAKADVNTAELNLGYTMIYAPVSGVSSFARIQNGAYVNQSSSLLTYVAQLDPMWVDFSMSEDDWLKYRRQRLQGQLQFPDKNVVPVEIVMADGSVYPKKGRLFFRDANYSTETGTFLIRATFPNPDGVLRPGQFVQARVEGGIRPKALMVPQSAVLQGAQGFFVWIVDDEGKAQTRNVEVGDWQGDSWFVTKGLSPGDRVITDGIVRLAAGTLVNMLPSQSASSTEPSKPDGSGEHGMAPTALTKSESSHE